MKLRTRQWALSESGSLRREGTKNSTRSRAGVRHRCGKQNYVERTLRDTRNEIEESFRMIRRDTQEVHSDVEKMRRNVEKSVTRMSDEIQHLNRGV